MTVRFLYVKPRRPQRRYMRALLSLALLSTAIAFVWSHL